LAGIRGGTAIALAVFFLLLGLLFAEIGLVGQRWAMLAGAACLGLCALTLALLRSIYASRPSRTVRAPAAAGRPSSSVTALRST
jgi:hypothetical protein